jgi:hypothetical protein
MGKGSKSRITDKKRYDQNYENIYGVRYARNCSQENQKKGESHVADGKIHDQKEYAGD